MLTYLLGPVLSLLPQRWRVYLFANLNVDWVRATLVSGLLFGVGGLAALVIWYFNFFSAVIDQQSATAVEALNKSGQLPQGVTNVQMGYGMGFAGLLMFAGHPLTLALAYFSAEGLYRTLVALVTEEAAGSGPLAFIDWVARVRERRAYERRVPLVADQVFKDNLGKQWNLKVESCRPKPQWKYPKVVKYNEDFFQVVGESTGEGTAARPHVYLLRAAAAGEAFRGMEIYDPNEALRPGAPTIGQSAVRAFRDGLRVKTLPLVADEIERAVDEQGVFLRVTSCRPKEDWPPGRVIRHEGCFYRMAETFDAEPPRPFGYVLQLLPAGVPGRRVIEYSPDDVLKSLQK